MAYRSNGRSVQFVYLVYGICLSADEQLPGLLPAEIRDPGTSVKLYLGTLPTSLEQIPDDQHAIHYTSPHYQDGQPSLVVTRLGDTYIRLLYADGTQFVLHPTQQEIWATWSEQSTLADTVTYLLGPVLGFFLRLSGVICLHGSAIAIDNKAFVIAGTPGAGKSTTAASLAARGYPILSDDIAALLPQSGQFQVQPAYPYLRLWASSVEALYGTADALPCLTPTWSKRYLDLTQEGYCYQAEPLPLAGIYVLKSRSVDPAAPWIEALPTSAGLIDLVANTYASNLLDRQLRASEFEALTQVVKSVPMRKVTPHADFSRLPKLCDLILTDFRSLTT